MFSKFRTQSGKFNRHQVILPEDLSQWVKYLKEAVQDFNNRPHHVLKGLTPIEVLNGKEPADINYSKQIKMAKEKRLIENKKLKCCYSF